LDGNGAARTSLDAGWRFSLRQAAVTQVAFADNAAAGRIPGYIVRTFEHTVLATDALVVEVTDDPGEWIFFIGQDGAPMQAGGFDAMVTGRGDGLLIGFRLRTSMEQADGAPGFIFLQSIERMTGAHTGFASGASIEVDAKGILFARAGALEGDQILVKLSSPGDLVPLSEAVNGG
jgi:hypothetical protein